MLSNNLFTDFRNMVYSPVQTIPVLDSSLYKKLLKTRILK
jgi:hypothetical protein